VQINNSSNSSSRTSSQYSDSIFVSQGEAESLGSQRDDMVANEDELEDTDISDITQRENRKI
jgi:hypothetical protein